MKNEYEIRGDVTAIIINSPKHGRIETLISTEKLERAMEFPNAWGVRFDKRMESFYVSGNLFSPGEIKYKRTVSLHRWVTQSSEKMVVDHINHQTLDNTDNNLRVITHSENMQNRKGATRTNSSGIRGVTWDKPARKWRTSIRVEGKYFYLGLFEDIAEAEKVVSDARKTYMPYSQEV